MLSKYHIIYLIIKVINKRRFGEELHNTLKSQAISAAKMQLSGQLGIFVILIIISVDALLESSVLSALSSITPFTLQPSLIGSFLTGIISGAPELTPQCYICDVIATLSPMASCTRRGSCLVETAKLVNFYCVKAYVLIKGCNLFRQFR